jgi:hypothetical protein
VAEAQAVCGILTADDTAAAERRRYTPPPEHAVAPAVRQRDGRDPGGAARVEPGRRGVAYVEAHPVLQAGRTSVGARHVDRAFVEIVFSTAASE